VNDWPAHLHHVEQLLEELGAGGSLSTRLQHACSYQQFMHYHGPNTYAAGFLYLYTPLYWITGGSLAGFQLMWAVLEVVAMWVVYRIAKVADLPVLLAALLPVVSNRLHLYNVRVVINDISALVPMLVVVLLIARSAKAPTLSWKSHLAASCLYSFVLANKLNFVFYGPGLAASYLLLGGFRYMMVHGVVVGSVQVILGLPFLVADPSAYLRWAYDVRRELLWEKTRNMKFVGREIYESPWFGVVLMLVMAIFLVFYFGRLFWVYLVRRRRVTPVVIVHAFAFGNFVCVALARGLYTPFMCWYFYLFPAVCLMAGMPASYTLAFFVAHEYLFRFFPHSLTYEMTATWVYLLVNIFVLFWTLIASPIFSPRKLKNAEKQE
jgi:alpha-1,3-mannosyltransferase